MSKLKNVLLSLCGFFYFQTSAQVVINNAVIINVNGGNASTQKIHVVLASPTSVPIKKAGTGTSGILLDYEYSILKYNLGTATTSITVPYISSSSEMFPLTFKPTVAGVGAGSILFSSKRATTRATGWDNALYMPSGVTHMNGPGITDNSASVIDRFWIVDGINYTTTPAANYSFTYINAEGAANGGNSFLLANLQAQPFDRNGLTWGNGYFYIGGLNTTGATTGTVSNVSLNAGLMGTTFRSWTLADKLHPLPVSFLYFKGACRNDSVRLQWETATETNSAYFEISKLENGETTVVGTVPSAGNSSTPKLYTYSDLSASGQTVYYQLTEVDVFGHRTPYKLIDLECSELRGESVSMYTYDHTLYVTGHLLKDQEITVTGYDVCGRLILKERIFMKAGTTKNTLQLPNVAGVYLMSVLTGDKQYVQRVIVQ